MSVTIQLDQGAGPLVSGQASSVGGWAVPTLPHGSKFSKLSVEVCDHVHSQECAEKVPVARRASVCTLVGSLAGVLRCCTAHYSCSCHPHRHQPA